MEATRVREASPKVFGVAAAEQTDVIPEDPIELLARERFHVPRLMPLQRFVIANILDNIEHPESAPAEGELVPGADHEIAEKAGHSETYNQLVLFPTGFGKSICFQLPALILEGLTLVVYPLLALMNDQKRRLDEAHIPCALFRGGLSEEEWHAQEALISSGKAKMVVVNPEILCAPRLRTFLGRFKIAHFVIDEAHCIREWGETFRPSYLTLGESARFLSPRILSAFTATAGPSIVASIEKILFLDKGYRLVTAEADRPNILYGVVHALSPRRALRQLLLSCKKPAIVFERSRPGTRIKAAYLQSIGFSETRFYHAGLSRQERKDIESWFQASDDAVLVSTNAYGMGMDKKNIRTVIHTSLPDSAEAYIQEAGRGGRDGKDSLAILIDDLARSRAGRTQVPQGDGPSHLLGPDSRGLLPGGLHPSDLPPAEETVHTVQNLRSGCFFRYPALQTCRREFLLHLLGEQETPACGRCDNCLEDAEVHSSRLAEWRELSGAEGFLEALFLCNAHQRRWTMPEFVRMLGPHGKGKGAFAGLLFGWTEEEREELVQALIELQVLQIVDRGPWKHRISLGPKGPMFVERARGLFQQA
jgi:ATP-dependent DNA helicase RecQ